MDDLISRKQAIDALGERPTVWTTDDEYSLGARNQYDTDKLAIETAPSAQPEPSQVARDIATIIENEQDMRVILENAQSKIIRCKDCKFYLRSNEKCRLFETRLHFYEADKTWGEDCFCSWAESD